MDITLAQVQSVSTIVLGVGALVCAAIMWRLKGEFAARGDVKALAERVDRMELEQAALSARVEQGPTHEDIARLRVQLGEVAGDVKALNATVGTGMQGVREQLAMLVKHQLEKVS